MSPDSIFQLCSGIAMIGWLILIVGSPFIMEIDKFLIGTVITLFCIVYIWLIVPAFSLENMQNLGRLDGVVELFKDRSLLTAGWVHYLAFDLLVGLWIKRNSLRYGIPHIVIILVLLVTFMAGPVGFLIYILIRWAKTKRYFASNF